MSKFKQEVDIPPKSVMIVNELMSDKRLNKSDSKRLTIAYVYGLLRRTFNLSLNNPKKHYLKSYNLIYCINRHDTLAKRSGLSSKTISRAVKVLSKVGYLITISKKRRHLVYIGMPYVVKDHLTHPNILKAVDKYTVATGQKYYWEKTKLPEAPDKNTSRCNDSCSNVSDVNGLCCNGASNEAEPQQQDNKTKAKVRTNMNKWLRNTIHNSLGLPKNVLELIRDNFKSSKQASSIVRTIIGTKNQNNMRYNNIYDSDYYKNETNPYIQNGSLLNSLKDVFNNNLDLKLTIATDYRNYIDDNSNLQLKNTKINKKIKDDRKFYSGLNQRSYLSDLKIIRNDIAKDKDDSNKLTKDKQRFREKVYLACKYTDLKPKLIKGTKAWKKGCNSYSNPALYEREVKKCLKNLVGWETSPSDSVNNIKHVTVRPEVWEHHNEVPDYDISKL